MVCHWSHCWTRCHLLNCPTERDSACMCRLLACVLYQIWSQARLADQVTAPLRLRPPAFWQTDVASRILSFVRSQPSSVDKTWFVVILHLSSPWPRCFNSNTVERLSTNQPLRHIMHVGVSKTLCSRCVATVFPWNAHVQIIFSQTEEILFCPVVHPFFNNGYKNVIFNQWITGKH